MQFSPYRELLAHVHSNPPKVSVQRFPKVQLELTFEHSFTSDSIKLKKTSHILVVKRDNMVTETTTNLDQNPLSQLLGAYETSELTISFPKGPSARYLSIVQRSLILLLFDITSKSKSIMVSNRSVTSFYGSMLAHHFNRPTFRTFCSLETLRARTIQTIILTNTTKPTGIIRTFIQICG